MTKEYKQLLALKKYLFKDDANVLQQMVDKKRPVTEINAFLNNAITDKQIKTTKLLSSDEALMEFREYEKKLTPDELQWVQKFYYEMYGNAVYNVPKNYRLLKTKDMLKESNRIRNTTKSDIYDRALKSGKLSSIEDSNIDELDIDVEINWEQIYSFFGYEAALNFLIDECLDELKIRPLDQRLTLIRYYVKMNRLRIEEMRDKRIRREKKK